MKLRSTPLVLTLSVAAATLTAQSIPTREEIVQQMTAAAAAHPSICKLLDLNATYGTPLTHQGRSIYAVKISDNVDQDEDEEAFLLVGTHHGNEFGCPIVGLDAMNRLLDGYGTDPRITAIVDSHEIWIAPLWNTDGYPNSRNNRRPGGSVDLNRNYPFLWSSACNTGVKGPAPGSEPETQTMMAFSAAERFDKVIDFHSSGRETLWGYIASCGNHVLSTYLRAEAIAISTASSYGGTVRGPSSNGEHYQWQTGTYSNYAFLTEISNTQSPSYASAVAEAARLWPGTLFILEHPIPVWGHVTDAATGAPLEVQISYVENPFTQGERNPSEPKFGRYHAFLPEGNHTLRFSHPCYVTQDVPVTVTANSLQLEVAMVPVCAQCALRNGSGVNPVGFACVNPPVLGATWNTTIATAPTTQQTYLGLATSATQAPLLGYEVLIDLAGAVLVPGLGNHAVAVPNDASLAGADVFAQGFRLDLPGGVPTGVLLNAQDVRLGIAPPQ